MLITITPDVDYRSLKESPSPEEFFLLSRLKGEVSVGQLCAASGLEKSKAKNMIARLIDFGLISTNEIVQFDDNPLTGTVALPNDNLSELFEEPVRRTVKAESEITKPGPEHVAPAETRPVSEASEVEEQQPERTTMERVSINDMFANAVKEESISLEFSDVAEISLDLLKGDSRVIEIAEDSWADDDDEDDMFGGDDEPLEDNPRLSSFMDQIINSDDEELFSSNSVAHESKVHKAAPKVRDTRPKSSQLGAVNGSVQSGFQSGSVPLNPEVDLGGFGQSLESFKSPFPREMGVGEEEQKRVDFVFSQLTTITYYQLFNLSPDADRKAIKSSYFVFSKYFHPDSFFGETNEVAKRCEKVFKFGSKAYDTLSRKKKKAAYDDALAAHLESIKQHEDNGKIKRKNAQVGLLLKVDQLANSGNFEQALIEVRRAIALGPTRDVLLQGANLHLRANVRLADAAGYVRMILKADKNDVEALVLLGRIYEQNAMFADALKLVRRAAAIKPNDPTVKIHVDRLISLQEKGS